MTISLKNFCLALGLLLLATAPAWAQGTESLGVPVKIWGRASSLHESTQPEPSEFTITGPAVETYPGAADGAVDASGLVTTPNTNYTSSVSTVKFEPNKTYALTAQSFFSFPYQELHVVAPPGYLAEIDGVARPSLTLNTYSHVYTVRILAAVEFSPRAGAASSLSPNKVQWQVSLGSLETAAARVRS